MTIIGLNETGGIVGIGRSTGEQDKVNCQQQNGEGKKVKEEIIAGFRETITWLWSAGARNFKSEN